MNNLAKMLIFFVHKFPRKLTRTELVKVIYYFEYLYYQLYKKSFCNISFKRDFKGPFTWDIPETVNSLDNVIACDAFRTYYGNVGYMHYITDENIASEVIETLPYEAYEIGQFVIEEFKDLNLDQILKVVYDTPPMEKIINEEKERGYPLYERGINMAEKKSVVFKPGREKINRAKKQLNLERRGSDEEYLEHFLRKLEALEPARRRATKCLLN